MPVTGGIADYVQSMWDTQLPEQAREGAGRCILDLLSATIVGAGTIGAVSTCQVAKAVYGRGASPIWFSAATSNALGAAWSNSAAASALDLDDGNRLARGHAGASVIPATLAMAAELGSSSEEIFKAIAIGYEVGVSISSSRRFYASSGSWGAYAAAAAIGFLRRTPPDVLSHGLAIAGMLSPHLLYTAGGAAYPFPMGSDVKEGIPWATVTGMKSLLLAEAGHTGPLDILDNAPDYSGERIIEQLGRELHVSRTYFKLYTCCRHLHAPIDALRAVMEEHMLQASDIEAVDVFAYSGALRLSNRPEPANLIDVQYSIPYTLGLAATIGPSALLPITGDVLRREDAMAIARNVKLHLDPELDRRFPAETPVRIVLTTRDGRRIESAITTPRGEATDPLSWNELKDKFATATRNLLGVERRNRILAAADKMRQGDMTALFQELREPPLPSVG